MTTLRPLAGAAGEAVAKARHPAACGGRPDVLPLARRVCRQLGAAGVAAPEVAAAVVATRGAWGVDRVRFAGLLGLGIEQIHALEGGRVHLRAVPAALLVAEPFPAIVARLRRPGGSSS